ncbi:TetR/AcrR family transcriptional regulator [Aureispira anguillae]|uniref:TetR/AcrR family transcriptional regulator n=1 Tax=Aureispira anguillae TaxID=2864201 RepID=A0A915YEL1_9BACT|nr:TetR/AcrR family transcriptional regulator [Aureispira anguillae]BDS11617.1 TetR/AcrR family transcriptional regulator [Aureispira anguillae]
MKKTSVKNRIIETASTLFYHNGYNQTGINQIIAEAGVSKSGMYQHFRSKEDIAVAYLIRRHSLWFGDLFDFIADQKSIKAKILAAFDYLDSWLSQVSFRGCGFQNIFIDLPKDQQKIKDQVLLHKNELRAWLHGLLNTEALYTTEEAIKLGDEILVLIEGAIILSQIQHNNWPIITAKNTCKKLLL